METAEISKLADKLREHGDDVLNGLSKLSLSASQLIHLNQSFTKVVDEGEVMTNSFHVINTSSGKIEELTDLQFLHDFVQRIVALKLTPPITTDELVDVSNFKNLKLLEVNKLTIKAVKGVHNFRSKLLYLTCVKSLASLEEVLESCGADESSKYVWSELKCANFSYNSLKVIDSSIEMAPFLHTLDLSHNEIQDASALNCLLNLQHLNLSYNKLTRIPLFGVQICSRLQVLVASNNFIEDINEVGALYNLCELDLAQNCLIGHNTLVSLASLATLQWLNLKGNPLVYHPQHRNKAASCLHINTNTINFILDHSVLSKSERKYVGSLHPRMYTRPTTIQPSTSQGELSEKFRRIRQVTISDSEPSPIYDPNMSSLCMSLDHLETKKQIEQLVKEYGENWLERKQGLIVQDVLGFEKKPLPTCSTPIGSTDMLIHEEMQPKETFLESSEVSDTKSEAYISASDTVVPPDSNSLYENDADDEDEDVVEGDENVYLATIYEKTDQVFIEITDSYIFEREATCSRERTRWPTKSLILCELYKDYIQLYFDTVRYDCRERRYVMEVEEMERLSNTLSEIVAKRPSEDCNLTVYNCIKCSSQFSKDKKLDNCKIVCPTCQSEMVFKADD